MDLPTSGPAFHLVEAVRLAVPVALGALAAGWILARGGTSSPSGEDRPLPPWRPWPWLALQPLAFAGTLAVARRTLGEGAPPLGTGALGSLLLAAAAVVLLALLSAAPPRFYLDSLARGWRHPVLAIAVGVLSWRAANAAEGLWGVLSAGTLAASGLLLRIGPGEVLVDLDQRVLGLDGFEILVAPVCSGADGLGLVLLFQATWLSLARERLRFPRALALLPLGAAAALSANVLRISALMWLGASGHEDLAAGGFHSKLGWILFIAIALGTVAIAERVEWFRSPGDGGSPARPAVPSTAAAWIAPLLAALATALLTGVFADEGFDRWYAARVLAAGAVLFLVRSALPRPSLPFSWIAAAAGALAALAWIPFAGGGSGGAPAGLLELSPAARAAWIAARVAGSCTVVPLVEELAFRGFLLRWLVSPDFERLSPRAFTWPAVIVSSLAFGAMHHPWELGAATGLVFAAAFLWRGRLSDAVLAHALANVAVAVAVLGFGRWDLWTA